MKSFLQLLMEDTKYLYHGTSEGAFRNIRLEGLKCSKGKIYFSDSEQYSTTYSTRKGASFGPRLLRVVKTKDFIKDTNIPKGGDYIHHKDIPPDKIEVKVKGEWMPIQSYYDENLNIMKISE